MKEPMIIQGGMGVAVSNWRLARAVSKEGQLGVVSGTALDNVMARRLQMGDLDGSTRRAMEKFPDQEIVRQLLARYYIPGGKAPEAPFKPVTLYSLHPPKELVELTMVGNFVEVYLAKEGHPGKVGVNLLEKIQLPTLPSLYGAMLAGVDYVLMGAGIPRTIPGILDQLATHQAVSMKVQVQGAAMEDDFQVTFDPADYLQDRTKPLNRPKFIAIVASEVLALTLAKKSSGQVDGFVIEGPTAGGHNAPPRGAMTLDEKGEPIYGPKDEVDKKAFVKLGRPFWLAGSYADPKKVKEALEQGASGVQVGTVFAYCEESGLTDELKQKVFEEIRQGREEVFTDPKASPTGFPFKIVKVAGSVSEESEYLARPRLCDLGYLRVLYKRKDGTVGYRCPGEPKEIFLQKEGDPAEMQGRKCICNGLMASIGFGQHQQNGYVERPLVTSGNDLYKVIEFLKGDKLSYTAADVIRYLLGIISLEAPVPAVGG